MIINIILISNVKFIHDPFTLIQLESLATLLAKLNQACAFSKIHPPPLWSSPCQTQPASVWIPALQRTSDHSTPMKVPQCLIKSHINSFSSPLENPPKLSTLAKAFEIHNPETPGFSCCS